MIQKGDSDGIQEGLIYASLGSSSLNLLWVS